MPLRRDNEDWQDYRRLILDTIKDVKEELKSLRAEIQGIKVHLAIRDGKSIILGAIGGLAMSAIFAGLVRYFIH